MKQVILFLLLVFVSANAYAAIPGFTEVDANNNGNISFVEFKNAFDSYSCSINQLGRIFTKADSDETPGLNETEYQATHFELENDCAVT